jgi:hypothetical protein
MAARGARDHLDRQPSLASTHSDSVLAGFIDGEAQLDASTTRLTSGNVNRPKISK